MKKTVLILLAIFIVLSTSSCNDKTSDSNKPNSKTNANVYTTTNKPISPVLQNTENSETPYIYKNVYWELFGKKQKVEITEELNSLLEASINVQDPKLTDNLTKLGTILVQYKDDNELIEFGTIYTDSNDNMYIYAFENEHNGVLLVPDTPNNTNTNIFN